MPGVVRCYDSIVFDHDQLAFQPPYLINYLLELPFEGLSIFSAIMHLTYRAGVAI